MKPRKWVVPGMIVAIFLIGVWTVEAGLWQKEGWGHGKARERMGMKFLLKLHLTPSQQEAVSAILSGSEEEMESLRDEAIQARRRIASLTRAEPLDETELRQACREASSLMEDIVVLRARMMQEILGVLTPEQKERLAQLRSEQRERQRARFLRMEQGEGE